MNLDLNFAGLAPTGDPAPLEPGNYNLKIVEAEYVNEVPEGKYPHVKIMTSPNTRPGDPNETKKILTFFTMSPKEYPRQLFRDFLEAVLQTPLTSEFTLNVADLIGRTVHAIVSIEDKSWISKRTGKEISVAQNVVVKWMPDNMLPTGSVSLQ